MKLHSVREGWRIAIDQLRANKLRSALTVLGVVIGIATVMAMASIVAGIGCVVGGIVIMNIMLMSVTERTREIGIRKALGAARRDIRRQFFAEALTLSVLGGVAGLVVGVALAGLVQAISPLPARVTGWSIGLGLVVGIAVGITFGVYPAHRASRLDPIEALRQE